MARTAVLDYELVVPIFPQGLAFLAWDDFHARWNREQECENYGAEKDNQGKDDGEKGKELQGKPGVT